MGYSIENSDIIPPLPSKEHAKLRVVRIDGNGNAVIERRMREHSKKDEPGRTAIKNWRQYYSTYFTMP